MAKQRGYPDRRGMGAQSDFISETFVPSEAHQAMQIQMARSLIASGFKAEDVAHMLSIPIDLLRSDPPIPTMESVRPPENSE
jgi:hypothetical protein